MRVLVLTADFPPYVWSGIGSSVGHQVQGLAKLGCEVDVLTTARNAAVSGVRVTQLETSKFPAGLRGRDVIHLHSLRLGELALELRRRDGTRLVYTAHSLLERELGEDAEARKWKSVQEKLMKEADHVVLLSEVECMYVATRWPELYGRCSVLPHGVPVVDTENRELGEAPVVLFAGRFCRSKGTDVAVGAMDALLRSDLSATCVLAGGRGDAGSHRLVSELAAKYPGRCSAPGWLSRRQLDQWLRRATVLLMPSRYEPFGMIALEAQAMGLPVLGAHIDGLSELLGEGSGGTTVEGHAVMDWADALKEMLGDRSELAAKSARGPRYVRARYGLQTHAEKYLHLLRSCAR